jgi:Holliday junction resolvase RusA-like endonuclease
MNHKAFIPCIAPKTTAQSSLRFTKTGQMFKDKRGVACRDTWVSLLAPHAPERPFDKPCTLKASFTWPWRKAEPKRNKEFGWLPMNTKPDLDNLSKIFVDSLVTTGWLLSDQIIWRLTLQKGWGDKTGVHILLDDEIVMDSPMDETKRRMLLQEICLGRLNT